MRDNGLLFDMDIEFASFVVRLSKVSSDEAAENIFTAAVFASNSVLKSKNICFDLKEFASKSFMEYFIMSGDESAVEEHSKLLGKSFFPPLERWIEALNRSGISGAPGAFKPLIIDKKRRLYLYKYWRCENSLAERIVRKIKSVSPKPDYDILRNLLDKYFPPRGVSKAPDLQKLAAFMAVRSNFTLISGGPGTGKTTTASKILAILYELSGGVGAPVVLAAPTGKAASRLSESITKIKASPDFPEEIKNAMPDKAYTVHRLLGSIPGKPGFIHNEENPIDAGTIVVDEASMISLPLMSRLMDAVGEDTRIIMLGDKDQLSSVEAGSVLADFCEAMETETLSVGLSSVYRQITGEVLPSAGNEPPGKIPDAAIILTESMRFKNLEGIGALASEVNSGNADRVLAILKSAEYPGLSLQGLPPASRLEKAVSEFISETYLRLLGAESPAEALRIFNSLRILCARKSGSYGADTVNRLIEKHIGHEPGTFYHGRPVMVARNDYGTGLHNGDVGIIWKTGDALLACFPDRDGIKNFIPGMLPAHETAFAMTIHKSQGSEFNSILMIMPEKESPLLTRELVYTGITRAREKVLIWGSEAVIKYAVGSRTFRDSGLRDALLSQPFGQSAL
ncbi:MAG: exodeoxyribonuclease V subunit alpha [Lentisphaerae bacterium GWF2_45_14]|nr:MAG: exodeoxyribonuclease V subunit alpha [Lentisphaerae bacterium GWF2_45_14]